MRAWLSVLVMAAYPGLVLAADARHPYSNINRRVDAGNDTGDDRVEALNEAQLAGAGAYRLYAAGEGAAIQAVNGGRLIPGVATIYPQNPYSPPAYTMPSPYPPPPYGWPGYPYPY